MCEGRRYFFYITLLVFFTVNFPRRNNVKAQQLPNPDTTTTLSQARSHLAATSLGELVFFGGGYVGNLATYTSAQVDICNVTSGIWTTATLSISRSSLAAASSGNLVLFGGGFDGNSVSYNQVDIYNISDGSWSTATLSQARYALAATSVGDIVLFGGWLHVVYLVFCLFECCGYLQCDK
jgi:hypothetical protein